MIGYNLKDKVVAVTGASSGIGLATARAFAREGARLAISARSQDKLAELAAELRGRGVQVFSKTMDVTDELQVTRYFEALLAEWGYCDVLVNNAGVGLFAPVAELSIELLDRCVQVNLYGALRCIRAVLPVMRARGKGQIINVSSTAGKRSIPYFGGYCATKSALGALSDALRVEVSDENIDVIVVCPGLTETAFAASELSSRKERMKRPTIGYQKPEQVADAIVKASKHRSREVVLSAGGRALVAVNTVTPKLVDKVFEQVAKKMVAK